MTYSHPDSDPVRRRWRDAGGPAAAVRRFGLLALAGVGATAGIAQGVLGAMPAAAAVSAGVCAAGASVAVRAMLRSYPHDAVGLCNAVTLVRLVLAAALVAPLLVPADPWSVFALALAALALDGVDGFLARRSGLVSPFGARFDMEVDSALALILAANAFAAGTAGPLVLALGLPRYAFAAAGSVLPWLDRPLPERFSRKAVCVLQIAALILLQLPVLPGLLAQALVLVTAAALLWSFGRDVLWLRAARA